MTDRTPPLPPALPRRIRSFVRREGRLTAAQARALETLLPRYGLAFGPQVLDFEAVFGRRAPRLLEIGFGDGAALVAHAQSHPDWDHLGIEVHRPGIGRLLRELEARGLGNVRVICHDASEVLETQIPDASLDKVLLYFPDPWPKKRHHKRRLVQPPFAALVARKLVPGGVWQLATDWEDYAQQMLEVLGACPTLRNAAPDSGFAPRPAERPPTRFERRGEKLGHGVWDLLFVKEKD
ncbi:MAG TPA: tRNA (guanosine(46)-N7)-methyltransferase TrmB [Gammaproteobacteria bacterium]|nr:tRNA (guanosine(46)-N7)-methyltransferase TrmB [Gammaproteobacteria bacterium]